MQKVSRSLMLCSVIASLHLFVRLTGAFLLFCITSASLAQNVPEVVFSKLPARLQLYPRNAANQGTVPITGRIISPGYARMSLITYRNNLPWKYTRYNLYYQRGAAAFYFYTLIDAALVEYRFEVYASNENDSVLVATRDSITCGDVYLINGQSNSHPSSSLETYSNEYCRTFGLQTGNSGYDPYNPGDTTWSLARGYLPYLSGVWGIHLQKLIVEQHKIPVCVINGGTGGSHIEEHMKDAALADFYTNTIYGKLLYRARKAGVNNHIKAIFWYQGEGNATEIFAGYSDYFNRLYNEWKEDYPSAEKIYVFQINIGCTSNSNSGKFREGQRQFGYSYPDIETIATNGLNGYDGCHYDTAGYHQVARNLFRLVTRDFYNASVTDNVSSPDIVRAYYTSTARKEVMLEFAGNTSMVWPADTLGKSMRNYFYLDGVSGIVSSGAAGGNRIRLKLISASNASTITYLPNSIPPGDIFSGPCLKNSRGLTALSFFEFPISPPPLIGDVPGCPAAFGPVKHIYGTSKSGTGGTTISANTTWYQDTIYILHDYVRVTSGATLTILPGTVIMGHPSPLDTAYLVVSRGAKLNAAGTAASPIVFTSCKLQGMRNAGDWGGIIICGNAPVNSGSNSVVAGIAGTTHGGTDPNDYSGTLQYVRIEYPGMDEASGMPVSGLTLAAVGRNTKVYYVQVSFSGNDSFEWLGGTVCGRYLISWKPLEDDFDTDNGYSGYNQFGLGYRDPVIADVSGSDGIESSNNNAGTSALPRTTGIFSNFELWGPVRSSATPYNSFFKAALHLAANTELKVYNSLFIGWPSDSLKAQSAGMLAEGSGVRTNAVKDSIRLRNCLVAAYPPYIRVQSDQPASSWAPFASAEAWYNNAAFKNSIKGNVLSDQKKAPFKAIPLFTLINSTVPIATGSSFQTGGSFPLPVSAYPKGFQSVNYRGAFGGTDWTAGWTEFHPQTLVYTAGLPVRAAAEIPAASAILPALSLSRLEMFPNPSSGNFVSVVFSSAEAGHGKLGVYDMLGSTICESHHTLSEGANVIDLPVSALGTGMYRLLLTTSGQIWEGTLLLTK